MTVEVTACAYCGELLRPGESTRQIPTNPLAWYHGRCLEALEKDVLGRDHARRWFRLSAIGIVCLSAVVAFASHDCAASGAGETHATCALRRDVGGEPGGFYLVQFGDACTADYSAGPFHSFEDAFHAGQELGCRFAPQPKPLPEERLP